MPPIFLNREMNTRIKGQVVKFIDGNKGVVLRDEDRHWYTQLCQKIACQRILTKILHIIPPFRIIGHDGLGQTHTGILMHECIEMIKVGKASFLLLKRFLPFPEEIEAINR